MSRGRHRRAVYSDRRQKCQRPSLADAQASRRGLGPLVRALGFECLERRLLLASDFGDAPLPYPTLIAENGAEHIATGPRLGNSRDTEADGIHSAAANGDGADEDSVQFGTIRVGNVGALIVKLQGGNAKLDAWIDFDGNGDWSGPAEQIATSRTVITGNNILSFDVPSEAVEGVTYARFRLSRAGGLSPGGVAVDGEVEDHAVTILPPDPASIEFGGRTTITSEADAAISVFTADLDRDGDLDVLSANLGNRTIAWYENDGNQNFTAHTIATTVLVGEEGTVAVDDVDGDGDLDLLAITGYTTISWYENDGDQNFTKRTVTTSAGFVYIVSAADMDGDGDLDVLAASGFNSIAWYENDGDQNFTKRTITTAADEVARMLAADMDGDGDLDVLAVNSGWIAWYKNDGHQNFTERTIATDVYGPKSLSAVDMNGDGELDFLIALYTGIIAWYENDGDQNFTERIIPTAIHGQVNAFAADMDEDGDLDVIAAALQEDAIAWYENDGDQNFAEYTISIVPYRVSCVAAADMDGDDDLDVLAATGSSDTIDWFENLGPLAGDYDRNNMVNEDDFLFWRTHFGETEGLGLQADGNGNDIVDAADYTVWRDIMDAMNPGVGAGANALSIHSDRQAAAGFRMAPSVAQPTVATVAAVADSLDAEGPLASGPTLAPTTTATPSAIAESLTPSQQQLASRFDEARSPQDRPASLSTNEVRTRDLLFEVLRTARTRQNGDACEAARPWLDEADRSGPAPHDAVFASLTGKLPKFGWLELR